MNRPPVILSIAGSDPSGGAGIQADIKTISALGGYAAAALTALTVQNTLGVRHAEYLPPELVRRQAEAVLEDLHPEAVKIGMTGTAPIVEAVVCALNGYAGPVVADPVMVSTSGHALTRSDAAEALCRTLLPRCRVATPNLDEAQRLLGAPIRTLADAEAAATALRDRHGCAFLIKGGHLGGAESVDLLCDADGLHRFASPRVETKNLHGTGCTLSSAIATLLGHGLPLAEAVRGAKAYIDRAIAAARDLSFGHGHGPLWHFPDGCTAPESRIGRRTGESAPAAPMSRPEHRTPAVAAHPEALRTAPAPESPADPTASIPSPRSAADPTSRTDLRPGSATSDPNTPPAADTHTAR